MRSQKPPQYGLISEWLVNLGTRNDEFFQPRPNQVFILTGIFLEQLPPISQTLIIGHGQYFLKKLFTGHFFVLGSHQEIPFICVSGLRRGPDISLQSLLPCPHRLLERPVFVANCGMHLQISPVWRFLIALTAQCRFQNKPHLVFW